jgi:hypothetical protein
MVMTGEAIGMKRIALGLLAAVVLNAGNAEAGIKFISGAQLQGYCVTEKSDPLYYQRATQCQFYILGVADSFACDAPMKSFGWLAKEEFTVGQLQQVVTKWLNDHPAELHLSANSLVAAALSEAFPCP